MKSILLVAGGDGHKNSSLEDQLGAEHFCALLQLLLGSAFSFTSSLSFLCGYLLDATAWKDLERHLILRSEL